MWIATQRKYRYKDDLYNAMVIATIAIVIATASCAGGSREQNTSTSFTTTTIAETKQVVKTTMPTPPKIRTYILRATG